MTSSGGNSTFKRKLAERKAAIEAELARVVSERSGTTSVVEHDADLVPDEQYDIKDTDREMDKIVNGIDILDAYARWCGKMTPKISKNQRESIMISCPKPSHPDKVPSAWINLDKQTYFCGGCQEGGDAHDIAAYHFGYSAPGYKSGAEFHKLRRDMAKDFGYTFTTLPGGVISIEAPVIEEEEPASALKVVATPPGTIPTTIDTGTDTKPDAATIIRMFEEDYKDINLFIPTIDWHHLIQKDTFLDEYMKATVTDDVAEEYHFWNGLIALGFALGRDVRLFDRHVVYGNLFTCTLGDTGSGKSKAQSHLNRLLIEALPHDWDDPWSKGVKRVSTPGSAEVLVYSFQKHIIDPSNPKALKQLVPVRGLIHFNELSGLTGRASRGGNVTIPTLMQFYDMDDEVTTSSLGTGDKTADHPFASCVTTSQPRALKDLLSKGDTASGFLNRWVFVSGNEKKRVAIGGAIIDMTPAVLPLQKILGWAGTAFNQADKEDVVMWSKEAWDRFTEFFDDVITPKKKSDTSDLLARTDLLMKKLILLFTANLKLKEVPVEVVEKVIELWDYIIASYAIPAAQIGTSIQDEIRESVLGVIKKKFEKDGKGATLRDISRSLASRKYPNDLLLKVCDNLVKLGEIKIVASANTKGRPTVRYIAC